MNARIETLAKAVGYDMINKAAMRALGFDVEKFAELIVQEMTAVFDKRAEPGTGFYEPHEPAELIRKHFGLTKT